VPYLAELHAREFDELIESVRESVDLVTKAKHIDSVLTRMAHGEEKTAPKTIAELKNKRVSVMTKLESLLQGI
jgi:uncharacterized protein YdcH (DUF465 family)